jgi:hypothetical protein
MLNLAGKTEFEPAQKFAAGVPSIVAQKDNGIRNFQAGDEATTESATGTSKDAVVWEK